MGHTTWQPKWWTQEKHGSAWERAKEALKRDWEQTKADVGMSGGRELHQNVADTVKQAAGKEEIPPGSQPNSKSLGSDAKPRSWDDVETPMMYGYGARDQYGSQHAAWNDKLEGTLKTEWDDAKQKTGKGWNEVRDFVRRGYERNRP